MATRRSRLAIKPNLGPKIGGAKVGKGPSSTQTKPKTDTEYKPKKETIEKLRKKVNEEDSEKGSEELVGVAGLGASSNVDDGSTTEVTKCTAEIDNEIDTAVQKPVPATPISDNASENPQEKSSTGTCDQSRGVSTGVTEKANSGDVISLKPKVPASPKNKVQMITRNRLPKARPNLADAGRPRKMTDLAAVKGSPRNVCGPSSPIKSPRPIISQSPDKALSSPEKHMVVARELQVHYPTADSPAKPSQSPARASGETTVAERRHRNLSGVDVPPIIERRQRQMSTSEAPVVGEKRHRHPSTAEPSAPKRKKPIKVDAPIDAPADRTKLKMGDLIYWNPSSNPMKKKAGKEKKKKTADPSDEDDDTSTVASLTGPTTEEVQVDDPEAAEEDEALPVPQVKIGPDGNIILNEESLVMKNSDNIIEEDGDIIDETESFVTYTSFRKQKSKLSWSVKETERFYKALSHIGTDFSLMLSVFPKRTRNEIKKKFAIEDKKNRPKVEEALHNKKPLNMAVFEEEEAEPVKEVPKKTKSRKKTKKENKAKDKSAGNNRDEWKRYYKGEEGSEEVEVKKAEQKRQQVAEARKRLLAEHNRSKKSTHGPEEASEIVEILMNMSKGSDPAPTIPHIENEMVMQSALPVVDMATDSEQLVQLLQTSGQAALIGDNVNEPLILVYNRPTVPGGETVIHVYKIHSDENGALSIPPTSATAVNSATQPNVPAGADVRNTGSAQQQNYSVSTGYENRNTTNFSTNSVGENYGDQIYSSVDINLTRIPNPSPAQTIGMKLPVANVPNPTTAQTIRMKLPVTNIPNSAPTQQPVGMKLPIHCVRQEGSDFHSPENVDNDITKSMLAGDSGQDPLDTNTITTESCTTAYSEESDASQSEIDLTNTCEAENIQEQTKKQIDTGDLVSEYVDDITSVVALPLEYT